MKNFEITATFGIIGTKKDKYGNKGEVKLCKVRWQGSRPIYDLRMWDENGKPNRGMGFTAEQLRKLREILNGMEIGDEDRQTD